MGEEMKDLLKDVVLLNKDISQHFKRISIVDLTVDILSSSFVTFVFEYYNSTERRMIMYLDDVIKEKHIKDKYYRLEEKYKLLSHDFIKD